MTQQIIATMTDKNGRQIKYAFAPGYTAADCGHVRTQTPLRPRRRCYPIAPVTATITLTGSPQAVEEKLEKLAHAINQ